MGIIGILPIIQCAVLGLGLLSVLVLIGSVTAFFIGG